MKLNPEIVYHELSKQYRAELFLNGSDALTLRGPEFYMDDEQTFLEGHLYVATVDHLPQRPRIQQNVCLVCIGDGFHLGYYKERLSLILIRSKADFFKVFRAIQEIYEKYARWENALFTSLIGDMDVSRMIAASEPVFETQMYVIDRDFHFVAASAGAMAADLMQPDTGALDPASFSTYLETETMMMERKNAFVLDMFERQVLCVNLFDRGGEYAGCMWLDIEKDSPSPGMAKLAEYLAARIETALDRNPRLQNDLQASTKGLMQSLIEEQPLTKAQRVLLKSINQSRTYACLYFRNAERHQKMPLNYICSIFEEAWRGSFAFVYDEGIAALLDITSSEQGWKEQLRGHLGEFCGQMRLSAGVSEAFTDLFNIRVHFVQAQSALEDGKLLREDAPLFFFSEYALTEMIINSLGGLPAETYFPEGLKAVLEHDSASPVSYLETLKVFLEENLSYTSTAKRLFVHRSTLIDRIDRIQREMHIDLTDSGQRLLISMLLKAMELEDVMRRK